MSIRDCSYYVSDNYKEEILERVGLKDLAVDLNARFACDIYSECEKEYQKTNDVRAFSPIEDLHHHFLDMIQQSLNKYHQLRLRRL
jgi:hypothetical protein